MHIDNKEAQTAIEQDLGAAFIASGIGSTVLGVMTVLAEISEPIRGSLIWFSRGGPLGGKTSLAVIAFVLSWVLLAIVLKRHPVKLRTAFVASLVLVAIGVLLTFPPVFRSISQLFGA